MMNAILVGIVIGSVIGLFIVVSHKGSRFKKVVRFSGDFEKMSALINDSLTADDYRVEKYGNETVYRKGSRMMTGRQFFKFSKAPDGVLIEAFVNLFGSNESGIDGFVGAVAKKQLKKTVDKVAAMIEGNEKN